MKRSLSRTIFTVAIINAVQTLTGCGGGSSDGASTGIPSAPPSPAPIPPSPSPVPPPPGAPPPPGTSSATISWSVPLMNTDGTAITDITAYRVYYGASVANLDQVAVAQGAGTTSHVISGLAPGTYYFAVSTVNSLGVASAPSNAVSKTIP